MNAVNNVKTVRIIIGKYRTVLVVATLLLAFFAVSMFSRLSINPDFTKYVPPGVGNRENLITINEIFGGSEKILLVLTNENNIINAESFDRLLNMSEMLQELDGIERCLSVADVIDIKLEDGYTTMDPLVEAIPESQIELEVLRKEILDSEMGRRFVSSDLRSMAIILTIEPDSKDKEIIASIENVIDEIPGAEKVHIGGLSFIRESTKSYIKKDLVTLLPAAMIAMVLMLYFSFREWKGVFLPFIVVVLSIVFSFGAMAVLGWEISIVSILLPIMLIAIANDYGIHLINLYQEKCRTNKKLSMKEIAAEIYRELRKPILITALTTMGGMLGLLSHKLPPAAELGVLAAVGIGMAFLLSLFLIPVLLTFYRRPGEQKLQRVQRQFYLQNMLETMSGWIVKYPVRIVASFVFIAVLSAIGLFFLKVDTNVEGYFDAKSEVRKGIELVNNEFGGSQYISVLFQGNILEPEVLARLDRYTSEFSRLEEVGNVISPSVFFKELSKGFYGPDEPGYLQLPKTEEEAVQYLEIFSMSGYEDQLSQFIDHTYENARILVSMKDGSNQTGKKILKSLNEITEGDEQLVCIAGPGLSKIQIAEMVIEGQISSLLLAFIIVFILLSLIFRSFTAGVKGILPLALSSVFVFGIMGFSNISLDIATTLLSSVMIGVGIDYTIHFLWRYKEEFASTGKNDQAINNTLKTAGRGIIFNALSVIVGFSVLIISEFTPLRFFGILVVISIFSCLMSALLLIPALITLRRPRFLEPEYKTTVYEANRFTFSENNKRFSALYNVRDKNKNID